MRMNISILFIYFQDITYDPLTITGQGYTGKNTLELKIHLKYNG